MTIKVKPEFENYVVGFGNETKALKDRTDLDKLVEVYRSAGDQHALSMFEDLPSEKEMLEDKANKFLAKTKPAVEKK